MAEKDQERMKRILDGIVRFTDGRVAGVRLVRRSAAWLNSPPNPDLVSDVAHSQIGHDVRLRSGERYSLCRTSDLLRNRQVVPYHRRGRAMQVSLSRRYLPSTQTLCIKDVSCPTAARFSLDGRTFLTCTRSGHVQQYAVEGRRFVPSKSVEVGGHGVRSVSTSPDGRFAAFAAEDGEQICILDFQQSDPMWNPLRLNLPRYNGQIYDSFHNLRLSYHLQYTSPTRSLLGSRLDGLFVHDLVSSNQIEFKAHYRSVSSTCYENLVDGTLLCSTGDSLVRVWDRRLLSSESFKPNLEFRGHRKYVHGMSARGNGRYLISLSEDCTVKLWDMRKPSSQTSGPPTLESYHAAPRPIHDVSIMTYSCETGEKIAGRCGFSPLHTTGQRFIYTESGLDSCAIYDILTGAMVRELVCIGYRYDHYKDISWHPYIDNFMTVTGHSDSVFLWE